jgi:hypothetical protein
LISNVLPGGTCKTEAALINAEYVYRRIFEMFESLLEGRYLSFSKNSNNGQPLPPELAHGHYHAALYLSAKMGVSLAGSITSDRSEAL